MYCAKSAPSSPIGFFYETNCQTQSFFLVVYFPLKCERWVCKVTQINSSWLLLLRCTTHDKQPGRSVPKSGVWYGYLN